MKQASKIIWWLKLNKQLYQIVIDAFERSNYETSKIKNMEQNYSIMQWQMQI